MEFASDVWEAACIIGKLVRTGREHDWKAPHQWVTEHRFSGNKRVVILRLEGFVSLLQLFYAEQLRNTSEAENGESRRLRMSVIRENVPLPAL